LTFGEEEGSWRIPNLSEVVDNAILTSIVARQVGGVHADSMANQLVKFLRSMIFPELGQSFTIGSITWIINAHDNGEIMEAM